MCRSNLCESPRQSWGFTSTNYSFWVHRSVAAGLYPLDWGVERVIDVEAGEREN